MIYFEYARYSLYPAVVATNSATSGGLNRLEHLNHRSGSFIYTKYQIHYKYRSCYQKQVAVT
ncbi:MAG: hypothetical protein JWQ40_3315 [Segetibacter sp.]|nr:hypothetical protein [Segetibacter sp.]